MDALIIFLILFILALLGYGGVAYEKKWFPFKKDKK